MVIIKSPDAEMIDENNINFFMTMKVVFVNALSVAVKVDFQDPTKFYGFHSFQNRIAVTYSMTANGQGLALWRYSVIRHPELLLSKDMKMKIYSIAGFYSSDGYVAG